ncbi:hypothetical protein [Nonomuraea sp. NPDC052265]|uniref:hypothetical protein n=1 Tax=Nonomuraea sp. NPDC052265 TaxID=3364374 RepID=UPI0037CC6D6E
MLQAYLVVPAFGVAYLACARHGVARRVGHLLAAGAVMVVSSAWWMVVVDLWPADSRPYVGGSTDNTVRDLVIGYNGLGRIFGQDRAGGGANFGGQAGAGRLAGRALRGVQLLQRHVPPLLHHRDGARRGRADRHGGDRDVAGVPQVAGLAGPAAYFTGSDPAMTVPLLRRLLAAGQLRYVLSGGGRGGPGGDTEVTAWVTANCAAVDGHTGLYDCAG